MSWVKLNVGGEMFETSRKTLTKFPDSDLAKMVSASLDRREDVVRLDIDPVYFSAVLGWLRWGRSSKLLNIYPDFLPY